MGPDGLVRSAKVVKGVTGLNELALNAVKGWTFEPARDQRGNPISAWYGMRFDFHF